MASDATKTEVKAAVESLFKVEVKSVQILNVKGKTKRFGKTMVAEDWKKAFVTLASRARTHRPLAAGGDRSWQSLN